MKKALIQALKLIVAVGLIYWLVKTKKITAEPFLVLWATPWLTFFTFGTILLLILINNYRWLLLLQGQSIRSSVKQTLPLTFIGLFFNLAMPGAVGGDFLKAYYITQEQPAAKVGAATSVLMDRIIGLYAMGLIALYAVMTHWEKIFGSAQLRPLVAFVGALVLGFTLFFILGFSDTVRRHQLTNAFLEKIPGGRIVEKIYDAIHAFRHGKKQFFIGILLSIIVQTVTIFCFYVIAINLHYEHVTMGALLFVVPLGLIATAVPLSPGGIGVGQTVFFALFGWYGGGISQNLGPTIMTIYQVVQAIWGLIGVPLYFMRKAPPLQTAMLKNDG